MSSSERVGEQGERLEEAHAESAAGAIETPSSEGIELTSDAETMDASFSLAADRPAIAEPSGETDAELLRALIEQVESLARSTEEANRLSRERERIIDRLHEENQQLRQGERQQAMLPVFRDLVRLFDDLQQTGRAYRERNEVRAEDVVRDFECYCEAVADILYRHGVERYEASEGTPFNPQAHRALGVVPTSDEAKERTIARNIRDGFRNETRIIRILEAEVYRFAPDAQAADGANEQKTEGAK